MRPSYLPRDQAARTVRNRRHFVGAAAFLAFLIIAHFVLRALFPGVFQ